MEKWIQIPEFLISLLTIEVVAFFLSLLLIMLTAPFVKRFQHEMEQEELLSNFLAGEE
jgi:sensor histidine kinase regulating citrate/malate metabolism